MFLVQKELPSKKKIDVFNIQHQNMGKVCTYTLCLNKGLVKKVSALIDDTILKVFYKDFLMKKKKEANGKAF